MHFAAVLVLLTTRNDLLCSCGVDESTKRLIFLTLKHNDKLKSRQQVSKHYSFLFVSFSFNSSEGILPIQAVTVAPVISKFMASVEFRTPKKVQIFLLLQWQFSVVLSSKQIPFFHLQTIGQKSACPWNAINVCR